MKFSHIYKQKSLVDLIFLSAPEIYQLIKYIIGTIRIHDWGKYDA